MTAELLTIGARLTVPVGTNALLWDMDGVLLDTLRLDDEIVNDLLEKHAPGHAGASREFIRAHFAYDPETFWKMILDDGNVELPDDRFVALLGEYEQARRSSRPEVHVGVLDILVDSREMGIRSAVVSNNPVFDVEHILSNVGLLDHFTCVIGNDKPGMRKKPAPDSYLEACTRLEVSPESSVVIEDSLLGAEAGSRAGCFTVGVATGANTLDQLSGSPYVSASYANFERHL